MKRISFPVDEDTILSIFAGERLLIDGVIYTARDAAHKKLTEIMKDGGELPVDLKGMAVYYAGPTPGKPGYVIGSCGPTTSGRMDSYTPMLLDYGLKAMIGKGDRSEDVVQSMIKNKCVYFAAVGGAGALISKSIVKAETVAFGELGTEAISRLTVKDFPVIAAIDAYGRNLYKEVMRKCMISTENA